MDSPKISWRRALHVIGIALVGLTLILAAGYGWFRVSGNIHVVIPGVMYRSAQLGPDDLTHLLESKHIRSILNLRGAHPDKPWYRDEATTAANHDVTLIDFGISANRDVSDAQIRAIMAAIEHAPKPILVHCQAGADRTGLVIAVYLADHGYRPEAARAQLSARYGHIPLWGLSSTQAMDDSLGRYFAKRSRRCCGEGACMVACTSP